MSYCYTSSKHILIKQTRTEIRQKYWGCCVWRFLKKCSLCYKYEGPPYQYPTTPAMTRLRLFDRYLFHITGIDNFGPLHVKPIFCTIPDNMTLNKVLVTLFSCTAIRAIISDLVSWFHAQSFAECFSRFVAYNFGISDEEKKFVSTVTQNFVSSLSVGWQVNLSLATQYGRFFEKLLRNTKSLLKKQLQNQKLQQTTYHFIWNRNNMKQ